MRRAASILGILGGLGVAGLAAAGLEVLNDGGGDFGTLFLLMLALGIVGVAGGVGAASEARWAATLMLAAGILELPIATVGFLVSLLPMALGFLISLPWGTAPAAWERAASALLLFLPPIMLMVGGMLVPRDTK